MDDQSKGKLNAWAASLERASAVGAGIHSPNGPDFPE